MTDILNNINTGSIGNIFTGGSKTDNSPPMDRRARIRPKPAAADLIYGITKPGQAGAEVQEQYVMEGGEKIPVSDIIRGGERPPTNPITYYRRSLLNKIKETNGLIFPYTPSIESGYIAEYASMDPVHTNQEFLSYTRTKSQDISVAGTFTSQNKYEAMYSLAAYHFLSVITKMAFGVDNEEYPAGTPPPVMLFSAWGPMMFNDLPVVIKTANPSYPNDVDWVKVPLNFDNLGALAPVCIKRQGASWVPAVFTINITMTVQNTPSKLRTFDLKKFRTGDLLKNGGWK